MKTRWEYVKMLIPLLAGVYLGFYVFGLVMGVYNDHNRAWMTAIAVACALGLGAVLVARRRGIYPIAEDSPIQRTARSDRERRGF